MSRKIQVDPNHVPTCRERNIRWAALVVATTCLVFIIVVGVASSLDNTINAKQQMHQEQLRN